MPDSKQRKPPNPERFVYLSTLTDTQLSFMTPEDLRHTLIEINTLWNTHLYPVVVSIQEIMLKRMVRDTTQDKLSDALSKAGIGEKELENLIASLSKGK